MDFGLNEEQEMLQKSAREFFSNEYSDKILKEMAKDASGYIFSEIDDGMTNIAYPALLNTTTI